MILRCGIEKLIEFSLRLRSSNAALQQPGVCHGTAFSRKIKTGTPYHFIYNSKVICTTNKHRLLKFSLTTKYL
jgi:hypothetical protein